MDNQVREEIVEWISKPENKEILETLKLIKEASKSKDWHDDLSEREKKSIKKGMDDHRQGKTLTNREFWEKHA